MRAVQLKHKGDFTGTLRLLDRVGSPIPRTLLERYGREGVNALSAATPVDTGLTSSSWYYEITHLRNGYSISFFNSNIQNGVPIALILQYGHGTRNGGWVQGIDYINPAIQPVFQELSERLWKEVANA